MFQISQCVKRPPGASGSSTISASDFACRDTAENASGGLRAAPLQPYFAGMPPLFANALLVIVMPREGGCGSLPSAAARSLRPEQNKRRTAAVRAKRFRFIAASIESKFRSTPRLCRNRKRRLQHQGAAAGPLALLLVRRLACAPAR